MDVQWISFAIRVPTAHLLYYQTRFDLLVKVAHASTTTPCRIIYRLSPCSGSDPRSLGSPVSVYRAPALAVFSKRTHAIQELFAGHPPSIRREMLTQLMDWVLLSALFTGVIKLRNARKGWRAIRYQKRNSRNVMAVFIFGNQQVIRKCRLNRIWPK